MLPLQVTGLVISLFAAVPALAQTSNCSGSPLTVTQIRALVTGNTVCGRPGPGYPGSPGDRFQEAHLNDSTLWDYKLGPGDAVDPRKQVGSWTTGGASRLDPDTITHQYTPTLGFTWLMFGLPTNAAGNVYYFCTPGQSRVEHVRAFIVSGTSTPCSAYPS